MTEFVYALNFLFNFFYGVFIPIIPLMDEETAGLAFTFYGLAKVLTYYFFGKLIDKGKVKDCLLIVLILFSFVPVFYLLFPATPIVAKAIEGIAFAGGTIFCFTFITLSTIKKEAFETKLKLIMICSSLGSLMGPVVGYLFIGYEVGLTSSVFLGVALMMNLSFFFFTKQLKILKSEPKTIFEEARNDKLDHNLVILVLLFKGMLVGIQPCIGFWSKTIFEFSLGLSGLAYFVSSLGFIVGTLKPRFWGIWLPLSCLFLLETSFYYYTLFWPAMFLFSFWLGSSLVKCLTDLGWVTTDKAGHLNSTWLTLSDLPLAVTPFIFWELKSLGMSYGRIGVLLLMIILVCFFTLNFKRKKSIKI